MMVVMNRNVKAMRFAGNASKRDNERAERKKKPSAPKGGVKRKAGGSKGKSSKKFKRH